jgi:hypothetical protein
MMPAIAVIDDRKNARKTLTVALKTVLPEDWEPVETDPLEKLSEYPSWITENDIVALILDERLDEKKPDVSPKVRLHVTYKGHDLVDYLRSLLPTIPIFIVTSYPKDSSLTERFGKVEAIVPRDSFVKNIEDWVPRITRLSQSFFEMIQEQLTELSELSLKVAKGTATKGEQARLKALQSSLQTPFAAEETADRSEWLNKLHTKLDDFDKLQREVQKFLGGQKRRAVAKSAKGKSKAAKKR